MVTFLVTPAHGYKRNMLVAHADGKSAPKGMVFCQTAGFRASHVKSVAAPAGSNKDLRPGVWVVVDGKAYVVAMPGYEHYNTSKPVLSLCVTLPPFSEFFLVRLRYVLVRGDEVPLLS